MDLGDDECHFGHAVCDVYRTTRESYMHEAEIQGRSQCWRQRTYPLFCGSWSHKYGYIRAEEE